MKRDEGASVGIGTLITFIAIVLVSMIVCSTIIITMEKAFKNQTNTAEATEQNGKIIIDSIFIYRFQPCWVDEFVTTDPDCSDAPVGNQRPWGHHQLLMNFHLAPGSTSIEVTNANYVVRCENEGVTDLDGDGINDGREVTTPRFSSSFSGSATAQPRAQGAPNTAFESGFVTKLNDDIRLNLLEQDQSYKIKLELFDNMNNNGNDEERNGCRISTEYDTTLLITLGGGSATEYTLHFRSYEVGQLVI
ncbi:MAG: Uncharacterised protein [Methanobacteriota archaeon]|nr:MAG: Uncharacterised protein [Euryarchaeota archaeon]